MAYADMAAERIEMNDLVWRGVLSLVTVAVLIAIANLLAWLTPLSVTDAGVSISLGVCAGLLVDASMRE